MAVTVYTILSSRDPTALASAVTAVVGPSSGTKNPVGAPALDTEGTYHQAVTTGDVASGSGVTVYSACAARDSTVLIAAVTAAIAGGKQPYGGLMVGKDGLMVQMMTTGTVPGAGGGGGASAFTDLTDAPAALGDPGQVVAVNGAGTALEFVAPTAPAFTFTDASGTPGSATINTARGRVTVEAASTSLTVTNSLCTANSTVLVSMTSPTDIPFVFDINPNAGNFVLTYEAAAADAIVDFVVLN